jgi:bacillithiol system protein YtxJ
VSSDLPPGWHALSSPDQIEAMNTQSFKNPVIIFKHSSRCSISDIAFSRLISSNNGVSLPPQITCYFLDIFQSPGVSRQVAADYKVHHESPQLLLIKDGQCVYETSHLDISLVELEEQIGLLRETSFKD